MVSRVFYNNLLRVAPKRSARKENFQALNAFMRLNSKGERRTWTHKEALLPGAGRSPVAVEVNKLDGASLGKGLLEWREKGEYLLDSPLDRAATRDFEDLSPKETLRRLENFAGKTRVVQSYPDGRIEAYAVLSGKTKVGTMENAPWNNPYFNNGRREVHGTASLLWEVLLENALLESPNSWKAQQKTLFSSAVVTDQSRSRMQIMFLRTNGKLQQPSGREILTALLHLKLFRNLLFEREPNLAALEQRMRIPKEVLAPFLVRIRDFYQRMAEAGYIKADR